MIFLYIYINVCNKINFVFLFSVFIVSSMEVSLYYILLYSTCASLRWLIILMTKYSFDTFKRFAETDFASNGIHIKCMNMWYCAKVYNRSMVHILIRMNCGTKIKAKQEKTKKIYDDIILSHHRAKNRLIFWYFSPCIPRLYPTSISSEWTTKKRTKNVFGWDI